MPSDSGYVGTPRKRYSRWFVSIGVGLIAGAVGYALAYGLGCSLTCAIGRSPLAFGLLIGVTAVVAAASGMSGRG